MGPRVSPGDLDRAPVCSGGPAGRPARRRLFLLLARRNCSSCAKSAQKPGLQRSAGRRRGASPHFGKQLLAGAAGGGGAGAGVALLLGAAPPLGLRRFLPRVCRPAVRPSPGRLLRPSVGPGPPQAPGCLRPPGHCPQGSSPAHGHPRHNPRPPSYPLHTPFISPYTPFIPPVYLEHQTLPWVYDHRATVPQDEGPE